MIEKKFMCLKEAAQTLGLDSRTAKKILINAKGVNMVRTKRKILINTRDLMEYMSKTNIIRY